MNNELAAKSIIEIILAIISIITISNNNNFKEDEFASNTNNSNISSEIEVELENNSSQNNSLSSTNNSNYLNENDSNKSVTSIQESKSSYIASCMDYNSLYDDMQRNPNSYKGKRMKFYGYVDSRWAKDGSMYAFTVSAEDNNGYYVGPVYCKIDNSVLNGGNLLQYDFVDVYGEFVGLSDNLMTIYGTLDYPTLEVKYVELTTNR